MDLYPLLTVALVHEPLHTLQFEIASVWICNFLAVATSVTFFFFTLPSISTSLSYSFKKGAGKFPPSVLSLYTCKWNEKLRFNYSLDLYPLLVVCAPTVAHTAVRTKTLWICNFLTVARSATFLFLILPSSAARNYECLDLQVLSHCNIFHSLLAVIRTPSLVSRWNKKGVVQLPPSVLSLSSWLSKEEYVPCGTWSISSNVLGMQPLSRYDIYHTLLTLLFISKPVSGLNRERCGKGPAKCGASARVTIQWEILFYLPTWSSCSPRCRLYSWTATS